MTPILVSPISTLLKGVVSLYSASFFILSSNFTRRFLAMAGRQTYFAGFFSHFLGSTSCLS
ncbi:hypothetical protein EVA_11639 [gut metagenome]|uniref:Uncharacterized protein n=1 Tax=gut metagenome TaxID=749906 RepID=J9CJK9_9ZZZZ